MYESPKLDLIRNLMRDSRYTNHNSKLESQYLNIKKLIISMENCFPARPNCFENKKCTFFDFQIYLIKCHSDNRITLKSFKNMKISTFHDRYVLKNSTYKKYCLKLNLRVETWMHVFCFNSNFCCKIHMICLYLKTIKKCKKKTN